LEDSSETKETAKVDGDGVASRSQALKDFHRIFPDGIEGIPISVLENLVAVEGFRPDMYMDSLRTKKYPKGRGTYGFGSLATPEELKQWPNAAPSGVSSEYGSMIPEERIRERTSRDARRFYDKALGDLESIPKSPLAEGGGDLSDALFSVNYQLGEGWNKKHPTTWGHLAGGRWKEAAEEAQRSKWFGQTPNRVRNFQKAILTHGGLGDEEIAEFISSQPKPGEPWSTKEMYFGGPVSRSRYI